MNVPSPLQSKTEMINTAKAIAANGQVIVQFANAISEQCTDKRSDSLQITVGQINCSHSPCRMKTDLQYCAEIIPTLSTQLRIIASVKASTPDDQSVSLHTLYMFVCGDSLPVDWPNTTCTPSLRQIGRAHV